MSDANQSQANRSVVDSEHLRILAIFHFVAAGFAFCGLLFIGLHFAMFRFVFSDPKLFPPSPGNPSPEQFFSILKWFYLVFAVWFLTSCVMNVLSGFFLRAHKHKTFSIVIAAWNCIYVPLGTILGVFTLIVLSRDSVKSLYEPSVNS